MPTTTNSPVTTQVYRVYIKATPSRAAAATRRELRRSEPARRGVSPVITGSANQPPAEIHLVQNDVEARPGLRLEDGQGGVPHPSSGDGPGMPDIGGSTR